MPSVTEHIQRHHTLSRCFVAN